jgi:hypothetical protein
MKKAASGLAILALASIQASPAHARQGAEDCSAISEAQQRLACYDKQPRPAVRKPPSSTRPIVKMRTAISSEEAAFGFRSAVPDDKVDNSSITALVAKVERLRLGMFRFTLDNGQIWDQLEMNELLIIEVGDTVRIAKSAGYRLRRENQGGWVWIPVSREK